MERDLAICSSWGVHGGWDQHLSSWVLVQQEGSSISLAEYGLGARLAEDK